MTIPRVFVSYSHDTIEHKQWVLDLASRMRGNGIDAILDQWELRPGDDLPHFMETNLASADFILMICTEQYVSKANEGKGGVGYEKMIITSHLMKNIDENKIIPIIRQKGTRDVPTFLKTKLYINFSKQDDYEFSYDELLRTVHRAPIFEKPEVGNNPFPDIGERKARPTSDGILELMRIMVTDYEDGKSTTDYPLLHRRLKISRIYLDLLINESLALGYLRWDIGGTLRLEDKGKFYAIDNKLVD